jgi:uncharacterized protein (DUF305 family)
MLTLRTGITALLLSFTALPALAADQPSESTAGYKAAMEKMHKAMPMEFTGDADTDFAHMMIPHHQGAIDVAKVELAHGKDPMLRKMAQDMIDMQEKEIAALKDFLAKHGDQH